MQNQNEQITDVEFKEVPTGPVAAEAPFDPAVYLTNALMVAGHPDPAAWAKHIDPRAQTAEKETDRLFFTNRSLRLYLSEQEDRENISPRMLLAEGLNNVDWTALMDQGIVPWLMNQFDKKGKRIKPEEVKVHVAGETAAEDKETFGAPTLDEAIVDPVTTAADSAAAGQPVNWSDVSLAPKLFPAAQYENGELVDTNPVTNGKETAGFVNPMPRSYESGVRDGKQPKRGEIPGLIHADEFGRVAGDNTVVAVNAPEGGRTDPLEL